MIIDGSEKRPVRSLLYIPGNAPGMIQNSAIYGADAILLDLEDAIAITEKDAARKLVKHALKTLDFGDALKGVRVNGTNTEFFEKDIREILSARPDFLRVPKVECVADVQRVDVLISQVEKENGIPNGEIKIQVMLETANAIQNAPDVAKASGRIVGLTLGGYDLLADLGIDPTEKELELLYARSRVIIAAKAAGVEVFDTVYPNIDDLEGLKRRAYRSVQLGFSGKAAIHPSQVSVIHEAYTPSLEDLERAVRVIKGATEAEAKGLGVVAVDGRMVDAPIIARAWRIVNLAHISGLEVEDL